MITASKLAGKFAAHAVWCMSDGEILTPMLSYIDENNVSHLERISSDDFASAVEHGRQKLSTNEMDANDAVLIYDGHISIDEEKLDALLIEMRTYFSPQSEAVLAIPYTPHTTGQFRVHKPKLLTWDHCEDFDLNQAFEAFFEGVAGHEKGSVVWEQCLDESK